MSAFCNLLKFNYILIHTELRVFFAMPDFYEIFILSRYHNIYIAFTYLGRISFNLCLIEYVYFNRFEKPPRIKRTLLHFLN